MSDDIQGEFVATLTGEAVEGCTLEVYAPQFPEFIEAEEGGAKIPTFEMLAYTGSAMRLEGHFHPVVVDLSGVKLSGKTIPILRGHDPDKIVGHGTPVVSQNDIRISGMVSADNEHSHDVVSSSKRGFPWQASIGASVEKMQFVKPGEKEQVNGKVVTGPLLIARATTLGETSFVPRGADRKTSVKVAAQLAKVAAQPMTLAQLHSRRKQ